MATQTKKTLEQILEEQRARRIESGAFGIRACKESILWWVQQGATLQQLLDEYVERANKDIFFNNRMVLACWELLY